MFVRPVIMTSRGSTTETGTGTLLWMPDLQLRSHVCLVAHDFEMTGQFKCCSWMTSNVINNL